MFIIHTTASFQVFRCEETRSLYSWSTTQDRVLVHTWDNDDLSWVIRMSEYLENGFGRW